MLELINTSPLSLLFFFPQILYFCLSVPLCPSLSILILPVLPSFLPSPFLCPFLSFSCYQSAFCLFSSSQYSFPSFSLFSFPQKIVNTSWSESACFDPVQPLRLWCHFDLFWGGGSGGVTINKEEVLALLFEVEGWLCEKMTHRWVGCELKGIAVCVCACVSVMNHCV